MKNKKNNRLQSDLNKRKKIVLFLPVLMMAVIFIESSIPMDGGPDDIIFLTNLDPKIQNLLHIPLYGVLAFLWIRVFNAWGQRGGRAMVFSFFITVFYGIMDEFHQTFVPGRYGGLQDIYLNAFGAFLVILIYSWISRKQSE